MNEKKFNDMEKNKTKKQKQKTQTNQLFNFKFKGNLVDIVLVTCLMVYQPLRVI